MMIIKTVLLYIICLISLLIYCALTVSFVYFFERAYAVNPFMQFTPLH